MSKKLKLDKQKNEYKIVMAFLNRFIMHKLQMHRFLYKHNKEIITLKKLLHEQRGRRSRVNYVWKVTEWYV